MLSLLLVFLHLSRSLALGDRHLLFFLSLFPPPLFSSSIDFLSFFLFWWIFFFFFLSSFLFRLSSLFVSFSQLSLFFFPLFVQFCSSLSHSFLFLLHVKEKVRLSPSLFSSLSFLYDRHLCPATSASLSFFLSCSSFFAFLSFSLGAYSPLKKISFSSLSLFVYRRRTSPSSPSYIAVIVFSYLYRFLSLPFFVLFLASLFLLGVYILSDVRISREEERDRKREKMRRCTQL